MIFDGDGWYYIEASLSLIRSLTLQLYISLFISLKSETARAAMTVVLPPNVCVQVNELDRWMDG